MKRKSLLGMLCITSLLLVACGDKIDTSKVEVPDVDKAEITIAPEVEDGCIPVLSAIAYVDKKSGQEKMYMTYNYNEDGSLKSYVLYGNVADGSGDEYIAQYNENGYICGYTMPNNEEQTIQNMFVDENGFYVMLYYEDAYELDENGNIKSYIYEGNEINYTYEDGKISYIVEKGDEYINNTSYTYNGNRLASKTVSYTYNGVVQQEQKKTYEGDTCTYEDTFYNQYGVFLNSIKKQTDERGVYTFIDDGPSGKYYSGTYNDDKTVYTLTNTTNPIVVYGIQIKFTKDGRPISVYKIGEDGEPLSDDLMCEFLYDKYGHLAEVIKKSFNKSSMADDEYSHETHYYFTRVPKDTYKDSDFYYYINRVDFSNLYSLEQLLAEN